MLAARLRLATGLDFEITERGARGIFLLRSADVGVPKEISEKLEGQGREAYYLRSRGQGQLLIVANTDDGLAFGAYQFLERLGYRFYFPGEKWTVVPRLKDVEISVDVLARPAFAMRRFAGTGGLGGKLVIDPAESLAARWASWKVANGFGEEFRIGGHMGEGFNLRYKELLVKHPEYLASVDGKRSWSKIAKLDPSNPDAVALFVRDRLEAYRTQRRSDPAGPGSFAVSVDAADGGGHCNSPECLRIGGPSEQQFFLANAVAKALAKEFPDARASLHAYNFHAAVPKMPIEPNVYVMLVPYAFRRDAASPETFIGEWVKKKSPVSIYDYWSIPDWVADAPDFDYLEIPAARLRYWHDHAVEGFGIETTYSAGAMGLGLYITGHLAWDLQREPAVLADDFFRLAFVESATPMRRMLSRWRDAYLATSGELQESFRDLADAFRLARSREVIERLVDYAAYVQYLKLRHEYLLASSERRLATKRALLEHVWRIYGSGMVDSYRLHKLLVRDDPVLAAEFNPRDARVGIWKSLTPFDEGVARKVIAAALTELPKLAVTLKNYPGPLVPALANGDARSEPPATITLVGPTRVELTVRMRAESPPLQLRSSNAAVQARILAPDQQELASVHLPPSPDAQTFDTKIAQPGTYSLEIRTLKMARVTLTAPANVGVELQEFRVPKPAPAPDLYFYVPKGERRFAIYNRASFLPPDRHGPQLLDGDDRPVTAERLDGGCLLVATVPPNQDGRIWALRGAVAPSSSLRLLNVPQRFALSRSALRVPAAALGLPVAAP